MTIRISTNQEIMKIALRTFLLIVCSISFIACSQAYYGTMEKLGIHKREILVDRVKEARESQQEGEEQFSSALEQFKSIVEVDGGNIQKAYDKLSDEYQKSREAADEISDRIESIESVSKALFAEWRQEIGEYTSANLKRESEAKLKRTEREYDLLIDAMKQAESLLQPVLGAMNDQVLFLKHNLNARAISSLEAEVVKIDEDVDRLLKATRKAIAEADSFIANMDA